ncbi:MAG: CHRD domain-containing protein [Acidimicrobiales bacterium]
MRRRLALTLLAASTLWAVGAAATTTAASAQTVSHVVTAQLSGSQEVPVPGPAGASGYARVIPVPQVGLICYVLHVEGIDLPATAAHIHRGAPGVAGPVVVTLKAPGQSGFSAGCAHADSSVVSEIAHDPGAFYVNVHNAAYPGGADRGQL